MKTLFMETTKIPADQTCGEIQKILGRYGASAILMEYKDGEVDALSFKIKTDGQEIPFRLPCRHEFVFKFFYDRKKNATIDERVLESMQTQAKRVAWRQILRWVEAQLAICDTGMTKVQEVFLPYMQVNAKQTVYDLIESGGFKKMLEAPR